MPDPVEHRLAVPRTARYYTLEPDPTDPTQVWIALHGYGQLAARFVRRLGPLQDGRRRVVAPEALNRYYVESRPGPHTAASPVGATWMTREDRVAEIEDYVRYLDLLRQRVVPDTAGYRVLGFSRGASTAARAALHGGRAPELVVLWGSPAPPDLDLVLAAERLSQSQVLLVAGSADDAFPPARATAEVARLRAAKLRCEAVEFAGGHELDPATLAALADR